MANCKKTKPTTKKATTKKNVIGEASKRCMAMEDKYGAHNYHPLPVVLKRVKASMCGT